MKRPIYNAVFLLAVLALILPLPACAPDGKAGVTSQQAGGQVPITGASAQNPVAPGQSPVYPGSGATTSSAPAYNAGTATGFIEVRVTDAPPVKKEVTSIMLTVSAIEVHLAGVGQGGQSDGSDNATTSENKTGSGKQGQQGGKGSDNSTISENKTGTGKPEQGGQGGDSWIKITMVSGNSFDLLKVKGLEELFAAGTAPVGKYTQVRLVVDTATVGFSDNTSETATVPGGDLKFVSPFEVIAGKTTVLTFDFDAEKSVNVTGSGRVMIKPVVKLEIRQK